MNLGLSYGFCLGSEDSEYTSAEFSDAFRALSGDGVTPYGKRFAILPNGFTLTVSAGYGFAAGRYFQNDEPLRLTVAPPKNNADRTDAVLLRVDYAGRKASIEILSDVKPEALREDPSLIRNNETYSTVLYFIRVRRGATYVDAGDITDIRADRTLCGSVQPLSSLTAGVLDVYNYFTGGIDEKLDALDATVDRLTAKTDAAMQALEQRIRNVGASNTLGSLETTRRAPTPHEEWLLCDGTAVPKVYRALSKILDGRLPDISEDGDRYATWIYAGPRDYSYVLFVPSGADRLITKDGKAFAV